MSCATKLAKLGAPQSRQQMLDKDASLTFISSGEDLDPATCSVPLRMLELLESRSQRWEARAL